MRPAPLLLLCLLGVSLPASAELVPWRGGYSADPDNYYRIEPYTVEEYRTPVPYSVPYYNPPAPSRYDTIDSLCDAEYARYRASIDCFNQFRNQNGSTRGNASQYCQPVLDPSSRCGPPRNW